MRSEPEVKDKARNRRCEIRWTEDEYARVEECARLAGLTVSEFVRRATLNRRITAVADEKLVGEMRRIAAMLKHLYPKVATWTNDEKANYWHTRNHLLALAKTIRERL